MPELPSLEELEKAARSIVEDAKKKGKLSSLTVRVVREEVEGRYGLEAGTLSASEYKKPLKAAVKEAARKTGTEEKQEECNIHKESHPSHEAPSDGGDAQKLDNDDKGNKGYRSKQNGAANSSVKKRRKAEAIKDFKSAEFIHDSSDVEDGKHEATNIGSLNVKDSASEEEDDASSEAEHAGAGKKRRKVESKPATRPPTSRKSSASSIGPAGKKEQGSKEIKGKTKGKQKSSEPLGKDEETVKKLKSLVSACGVRKVWSKVFQDCDRPSAQISKLKEMLSELGMSGRYSLEQAKRIRRKRELAQELEDVQSFEKSIMQKDQKTGRRRAEDEDDESEEDSPKPVKRKRTALQSITAFLEDQSDDE